MLLETISRSREQWFKSGLKRLVKMVLTLEGAEVPVNVLIEAIIEKKHANEQVILVLPNGSIRII